MQASDLVLGAVGVVGGALTAAIGAAVWAQRRSKIKAARLNVQLSALNRRVSRLEETLGSSAIDGTTRPISETPRGPAKMGTGSASARCLSPFLAGPRRLDQAEPTALNGPKLIAVPSLAPPSEDRDNTGSRPPLVSRYRAIHDLAEGGASVEAIARTTGYPIGQVELILGLRRRSVPASKHRTEGRV